MTGRSPEPPGNHLATVPHNGSRRGFREGANVASSIFVRPDGEADIVARGPGNTLMYHWATPGSAWRNTQVAGAGDDVLGAVDFRAA